MKIGNLVRVRSDWPWQDFFIYEKPRHGGLRHETIGLMKSGEMAIILEVDGGRDNPWVLVFVSSGIRGWTLSDKLETVSNTYW